MELRKDRIDIPGWEFFSEVEMIFNSFEDYIDTIEETINREVDNAETTYHKYLIEISNVKKMPEDYSYNFSAEWKFQQKVGLRAIYYDSLIFSIYAFVERKLNFLCQSLQENYDVKVASLPDEGIRKYRKYLLDIVGVNFKSIESEWNCLMKFAHLRNFLIHSYSGKVISEKTKNCKAIIDLLCSYKDIRIIKQQTEYVFEFEGSEILKDFIRIVRVVLSEVYHEST